MAKKKENKPTLVHLQCDERLAQNIKIFAALRKKPLYEIANEAIQQYMESNKKEMIEISTFMSTLPISALPKRKTARG